MQQEQVLPFLYSFGQGAILAGVDFAVEFGLHVRGGGADGSRKLSGDCEWISLLVELLAHIGRQAADHIGNSAGGGASLQTALHSQLHAGHCALKRRRQVHEAV